MHSFAFNLFPHLLHLKQLARKRDGGAHMAVYSNVGFITEAGLVSEDSEAILLSIHSVKTTHKSYAITPIE